MKYAYALLLSLSFATTSAQLHDNMWIFKNADTLFQIDFREAPPHISQKNEFLKFQSAKSVFCNKEGDLLYYTNCISINNQIDSLLDNGNDINPGFFASSNSIPVLNAGFFLPAPGDSTRCYFIYMFPEHFPGAPPLPIKVQYALIDMTANNGLGKVLEKNVPILTGGLHLNYNHVGAVRHANGRDWWILVPARMEPKYYRILLNTEGFYVLDTQEIGFKLPTNDPNLYIGYNQFTQDGTKYLEFEYRTGILQIYNFDRCSGYLSNPIKIQTPHTLEPPYILMGGFATSPSGKRLYASYANPIGNAIELKQYDLDALDILNSEELLWSCDIPSIYECSAGRMSLAPNGKIYIQALIDTVAYHVINNPNSSGLLCNFEFGGLVFPSKGPQSEPSYFPNYRLGPLDGSPCDTLGLDNHPLADFHWLVPDTITPLSVQFTDNSSYVPTGWFWDFGDGASSTEVNPLHEFSASGTYQTCLTVSNQYDTDTVCKPVTVEGPSHASELAGDNLYRVFPNPANGFCTILLPGNFAGKATFRLTGALGQTVLVQELTGGQHTLNLPQEMPPGLYFYEITKEGRLLASGKLVLVE